MTPRPWKKWGKWAALSVAAGAVIMTAVSDDGHGAKKTPGRAPLSIVIPSPDSGPGASKRGMAKADHVELERLSRTKSKGGTDVGNVFSAISWYVPPPPPPPPPPAPPPKPTAPPLPFTYLGRYEDAPRLVIILSRGDRVYTVSEGDVIDGTYRVEHVTAASVELMYLPLNIKQSLSTVATS